MKNLALLILSLWIAVTVLSCKPKKPDLIVKHLEFVWDEENKIAVAEITNIGGAEATNVEVLFHGVEEPVSKSNVPQITQTIPSLAKGKSITLKADFSTVSHPANYQLKYLYKVTLLADPSDAIVEIDENNNGFEKETPLL